MEERPSSPEDDDPNDPDFVPDSKPKGTRRRKIPDLDEDEESKAIQGGNDNNESTQEEAKAANDGGETTESEENNDEGTDYATKTTVLYVNKYTSFSCFGIWK